MRNPDEGRRWLEEAASELETARWDLKGEKYSAACFWSHQAAEKALKAFLYATSEEEHLFEHSLTRLLEHCAESEKGFEAFRESCRTLDRYYIPTRYPNGLPYPAVPAKSFTREEAEEAIALCDKILGLARSGISHDGDDNR